MPVHYAIDAVHSFRGFYYAEGWAHDGNGGIPPELIFEDRPLPAWIERVKCSDLAALSARGSAGSAYATSCARARCRANLAFGSALQPNESPSRIQGSTSFKGITWGSPLGVRHAPLLSPIDLRCRKGERPLVKWDADPDYGDQEITQHSSGMGMSDDQPG